MKKILSFILIAFFVITKAQSLASLDARGGIKEFKLGDPYIKWSTKISYSGNNSDENYFDYKGECCKTLFGYEIEKITLGFTDGKMTRIFFITAPLQTYKGDNKSFVKWRPDDFENINAQIVKLFGEQSGWKSDDKTGSVTYAWYGKKVSLLSQYVYNGIKEGDQQIIMMYINEKEDF